MLRFLCANTTKFCGKRLRENGCSWKKARKKSTLFKRCSVRRAATDTQVALPKGEPVAAQGQARPLYNLSVGLTPASSPSRGAFGKEVSSQRKGELAGLSATPEPPLLGEVALRSNDGEVVQSRALSGRCVASPFGRGGNAPALTVRARPLTEGEAAAGQRLLPQGFHLISLLRRQLPLKGKPLAAPGQPPLPPVHPLRFMIH